ncbi:1,4-alpha-glucan branching enzyme [hydrocarbon metagenome]|uniref:1,4-alpha-glucan branching enzyme n=1 Tax=hydrocarbon metagenome TaxID=938273 RepID=A0A0W8G7A1_9ZZZZ
MSLGKKCLKSKPVCKVTFTVDKELAKDAATVSLVGEFNGWETGATPMKKQKSGNFTVTLDLETGREYQFRYLIDDTIWVSDPAADKYAFSPFGDCDNSVVAL